MKLAADTVRIRHLSLQGTAQAIETARSQLNLALQRCNWPVTASEEIILLRRIHVQGNLHEIAAHAAEQTHRLARSAVDGWSAAASDALAVRFSNPASLIACLLRDLLNHDTQKCWYWRHWGSVWQQPKHAVIVTLLQDAPLFIPEIIARLHTTPGWKSFWRELGHDGAEQLLTAIAQTTGWQAITHTMQDLNKRFTQPHESEESLLSPQDSAVYTQSDFLFLQSGILSYDLSFLATDTQTPPHADARFILGAVLALWRHAPALLTQPSGATALRMLARTNAKQADKQAKTKSLSGSAHPKSAAPLPAISFDTSNQPSDSDHASDTDRIQKDLRIEKEKTATPVVALNDQSDHQSESIPGNAPQLSQIALSGTRITIRNEKIDADSMQNEWLPPQMPMNSEDHTVNFITQQGGLFYLFNFLNLPVVRQKIPMEHPGTGWRCLFDLARAFDCTPSGHLLDFIATECKLNHAQELLQQPPIIAVDHLMHLGAGRYGADVWQAKSWKLPARLIATRSHIDLHFRLDDARFDIRRTGLDMNPGWLPWLGRIVTFHYGSDREPGLGK